MGDTPIDAVPAPVPVDIVSVYIPPGEPARNAILSVELQSDIPDVGLLPGLARYDIRKLKLQIQVPTDDNLFFPVWFAGYEQLDELKRFLGDPQKIAGLVALLQNQDNLDSILTLLHRAMHGPHPMDPEKPNKRVLEPEPEESEP